MKLYHASNCIIESPDVYHSRELLDFGKGFYLTSLADQARKYSQRFLFRGDKAYLNHYVLDDDLSAYNVKEFTTYDEEWLDFVAACRAGKPTELYDIVSGGIADDKVFNTISPAITAKRNHWNVWLSYTPTTRYVSLIKTLSVKVCTSLRQKR